MSLVLTPMNVGDVTIIEVVGRITLGDSVANFRQHVLDVAAGGRTKILLNLAGVSYIDSSGIGELVSTYNAVTSQGGSVKLLKLTKRVHDLLQITKLSTIFEIFDDEAKAVGSFGGTQAASN